MFASRTAAFALIIAALALIIAAFSGDSLSQERIYRCGIEYTNSPVFAEARGCKLLETVNRTALKSLLIRSVKEAVPSDIGDNLSASVNVPE